MKTPSTNLNKVRKEKARDKARRDADANSAKYGRSKEQKELAAKRVEALRAKLDAHKIEKGGKDE